MSVFSNENALWTGPESFSSEISSNLFDHFVRIPVRILDMLLCDHYICAWCNVRVLCVRGSSLAGFVFNVVMVQCIKVEISVYVLFVRVVKVCGKEIFLSCSSL